VKRHGTHTDGSHVHCCPVDGLGTRLYPCGFATVTAAGNSPWPPGPGPEYPARSSPPVMKGRVRTAIQPESTGLELARGSRGVTTPVPCVYLPVSLTAPGSSGSAEPARLCRGCSRPHRRPPARTSSSFTPPLRRRGDGRSLTSIRKQQRLVAHSGCLQLHPAATTARRWTVFHLHPKQQRLVAH